MVSKQRTYVTRIEWQNKYEFSEGYLNVYFTRENDAGVLAGRYNISVGFIGRRIPGKAPDRSVMLTDISEPYENGENSIFTPRC